MSPEAGPVPSGSAPARTFISSARALSNSMLIGRVRELAGEEQQLTAVLIAHLAVLDERQLYLVEGCASMFTYLTQVLHFSEHAAYGRIQAARAARRYPLILDLLNDGSVNLTTITLLAPELTPRSHREVLEAARHKSRRQVEELIARLRPKPPTRSLIRRIPDPGFSGLSPIASAGPGAAPSLDGQTAPPSPSRPPSPSGSPASAGWPSPDGSSGEAGSPGQAGSPPVGPADSSPDHPCFPAGAPLFGDLPPRASREAPPQPRNIITPLAARYYRVQFTATEETHAKLRAAQDLLRHQIPDGDLGRILDRALSSLLIELTRRKVGGPAPRQPEIERREPGPGRQEPGVARNEPGVRQRPAESDGSPGSAASVHVPASRHIPADVRRTVWMRDGGRCAFVAPGGRRCAERGFLEFHHVVPHSAGGPSTADNIELRCRPHNEYEALQPLESPPQQESEDEQPGIHGTPDPRPPT